MRRESLFSHFSLFLSLRIIFQHAIFTDVISMMIVCKERIYSVEEEEKEKEKEKALIVSLPS